MKNKMHPFPRRLPRAWILCLADAVSVEHARRVPRMVPSTTGPE